MDIEKYVLNYVSKHTKWPQKKIVEAIEAAAQKGISPEEYVRFCCWELNDEEQKELAQLLIQVHVRQKELEDWFLEIAHRRSLRSKASIRKEMQKFKEAGLPVVLYFRKGFYYPIVGFREKKRILQQSKKVLKNAYFGKIRELTGWSSARTEIEVTKAWLNSGAAYENYYRYRMHQRSDEEQKNLLTRECFYKMIVYFNQHFSKGLLVSKSWFNRIFASCMKRKWFVNRNLSYSRFLKKIEGLEEILVKPVSSTHGKGIQKFSCRVEDKKALYNTIMALPKSIVEEYIVQHPDVAAFCSSSVNTLRIVTLNAKGKCNFLFAILRMGRGGIVDNMHAGGIAAGVDLETGVIFSDALDSEGNLHVVHPVSKLPIKGFRIPNWESVVELCQKCYNRIPGVNLIGWDIAITAEGVTLIEGNSAPAFDTIQAIALLEGKGLRAEVMDQYLPKT